MIRRVERVSGPRFEVYVYEARRKIFVSSHGKRKEAEAAEQDELAKRRAIARGELPPEVDLARAFGPAADEWIESLRKAKRRCADGYGDRVKLYLKPTLGGTALARITTSHVMALRDDLAERFAPATVNGTLVCLSSAMSYFKKRGWIAANPCLGVEPVEDPDHSYNWIRTREEMTRLLLACADELRDMVAMALGTGLRFDELLHLQWADVDLQRRLLTIHRGRQGTVKSGKLRHVPILDSVLGVLQARALKRGGAILVFPGRKGEVRSKQGVYDIFKLALKRARLDETLRWHDLRHSFASHWMMDSGCIFKLSRILGHSSVKITEQRYVHLAPSAFEMDFGRVAFTVPTEPAKLYDLRRDGEGRIIGRERATVDAA